MKILVTGHSGLVGNTLLKELKALGHEVWGVSRTDRYDVKENIITLDLTNTEEVEKMFKEMKPEIVYHLAANASESQGQMSPVDMVNRNLLLSTNVLKSSINAGVKKFIFSSSISVYGDVPSPYKETYLPRPKDVYGVNKSAFEQILRIMSSVHGIDYTILRPHNIYGPGQIMADPSKNVIALFMRRLLENKPYTLYGEGKMRRAFTYVDDVVQFYVQALDGYSKSTINIGTGSDISIKELSDLLQKLTGISVPIDLQPIRQQEMSDFVADHAVQDAVFSYKHTSLKDGILKTWEWVKSTPLPELEAKEKEIHA